MENTMILDETLNNLDVGPQLALMPLSNDYLYGRQDEGLPGDYSPFLFFRNDDEDEDDDMGDDEGFDDFDDEDFDDEDDDFDDEDDDEDDDYEDDDFDYEEDVDYDDFDE